MKKSALIMIILFAVLAPAVSLAQNQIIPNCSPNCGYYDLLRLVNNIINWIILVSAPIAAGVIAWAGFLYMTSGAYDQKTQAKKIMWKVFFGFVFILSAWLIVTTILNALLSDEVRKAVPVEGVNK